MTGPGSGRISQMTPAPGSASRETSQTLGSRVDPSWSLYRRVESGGKLDKVLRVHRLIHRFLAREKLAGVREQIMLRLVVSGQNEHNHSRQLSVPRVEIYPVGRLAHHNQGLREPFHSRVGHGQAVVPAARRHLLAIPDETQKPLRRVADRRRRQLAQLLDGSTARVGGDL